MSTPPPDPDLLARDEAAARAACAEGERTDPAAPVGLTAADLDVLRLRVEQRQPCDPVRVGKLLAAYDRLVGAAPLPAPDVPLACHGIDPDDASELPVGAPVIVPDATLDPVASAHARRQRALGVLRSAEAAFRLGATDERAEALAKAREELRLADRALRDAEAKVRGASRYSSGDDAADAE